MKVKITETGVFDGEGEELEVGEIVSVDGDEMPGWLIGKASVLDEVPAEAAVKVKRGKTAVTNPAADDADTEKDDAAGV
jgi:hypothetical protein